MKITSGGNLHEVQPLPEGFPERETLAGAGFGTVSKIKQATNGDIDRMFPHSTAKIVKVKNAIRKLRRGEQ